MAKAQIFTFDAIGRDLLPGERTAAQVFVRKYDSPPTKAVVQKQMKMVKARVQRAVVSGQPFTTAFYDQVKKANTKVQAASTMRSSSKVAAKPAVKRSVKG